ncbi:MAG TPA: oligoribonuclease [Thermoanaerobaculia bacterium]|nr:oligoribonuclease [Thermoanaerobaculia bacterium]
MATAQKPKKSDKYLVWIDCEMTGLDPQQHVLLEIATIITDYDLRIIARGPVLAIHQSESKLGLMDAWNRRTHGGSGLLERVRHEGVSVAEAERQTLAFVRRYCTIRSAPLCGNSIGQDRQFLARYMPKLEAYLNYRVVDVSSIKILVKAWYGKKHAPPKKKETHRALDDIEESIAELDFYRKNVFVTIRRPPRGARST